MAKEKKKIRVVTLKKAIEMLGISRMSFYSKYKAKLEHLPSTDNKCYFKEEDILELVKERNKATDLYTIVE